MAQSRGVARLIGWPLVVIFGCGMFSCVGFIWAAIHKKSPRWTVLAVVTTLLTLVGWVMAGSWQYGDELSNGAGAYLVEMWLAFVALAWVVSADYAGGAPGVVSGVAPPASRSAAPSPADTLPKLTPRVSRTAAPAAAERTVVLPPTAADDNRPAVEPTPTVELAKSADDPSSPTSTPKSPAARSHVATSEQPSISEFVPAHVRVTHSREVLDALPDTKAAAEVKAQLLDVIESEGPVELDRLVRIVGRRFDLSVVRQARAEEIARLVPRDQLHKSRQFGNFVWPAGLDPETWSGFRTADPEVSRSLEEIAPEEITNAMLAVLDEFDDLESDDDLLRRTAELFGIVRLGSNVRARLEAVHAEFVEYEDEDEAATEIEPSIPVASTHAPAADTVERLAAEVENYVPDFRLVPDYVYIDYRSDTQLNSAQKNLVKQIVADPTYDGDSGNKGVGVRGRDLPVDEAERIGNVAAMVWSQTVGHVLREVADRIVVHLAVDPEFDPLPWGEDINAFVAERLAGKRPALVLQVQRQLNGYAHERGLIARVEAEIQADARTALDQMSPLERDIYGFTSRNAGRLAQVEHLLGNVRENRRRFVVYWMSRFEGEENGPKRQARYATAVRRLAATGETRASISRTLGISASIIDRIERENPRDVVLLPDDPILTDLAPSLR